MYFGLISLYPKYILWIRKTQNNQGVAKREKPMKPIALAKMNNRGKVLHLAESVATEGNVWRKGMHSYADVRELSQPMHNKSHCKSTPNDSTGWFESQEETINQIKRSETRSIRKPLKVARGQFSKSKSKYFGASENLKRNFFGLEELMAHTKGI